MCRLLVLLLLFETVLVSVAGQHSTDQLQPSTVHLEPSLSTVQQGYTRTASTPLLFSTHHSDISSHEPTIRLSVTGPTSSITDPTNSSINLSPSSPSNVDHNNYTSVFLSSVINSHDSAFINVITSLELTSIFTSSILPLLSVDVTTIPVTESLDSFYASFESSLPRDVNTAIPVIVKSVSPYSSAFQPSSSVLLSASITDIFSMLHVHVPSITITSSIASIPVTIGSSEMYASLSHLPASSSSPLTATTSILPLIISANPSITISSLTSYSITATSSMPSSIVLKTLSQSLSSFSSIATTYNVPSSNFITTFELPALSESSTLPGERFDRLISSSVSSFIAMTYSMPSSTSFIEKTLSRTVNLSQLSSLSLISVSTSMQPSLASSFAMMIHIGAGANPSRSLSGMLHETSMIIYDTFTHSSLVLEDTTLPLLSSNYLTNKLATPSLTTSDASIYYGIADSSSSGINFDRSMLSYTSNILTDSVHTSAILTEISSVLTKSESSPENGITTVILDTSAVTGLDSATPFLASSLPSSDGLIAEHSNTFLTYSRDVTDHSSNADRLLPSSEAVPSLVSQSYGSTSSSNTMDTSLELSSETLAVSDYSAFLPSSNSFPLENSTDFLSSSALPFYPTQSRDDNTTQISFSKPLIDSVISVSVSTWTLRMNDSTVILPSEEGLTVTNSGSFVSDSPASTIATTTEQTSYMNILTLSDSDNILYLSLSSSLLINSSLIPPDAMSTVVDSPSTLSSRDELQQTETHSALQISYTDITALIDSSITLTVLTKSAFNSNSNQIQHSETLDTYLDSWTSFTISPSLSVQTLSMSYLSESLFSSVEPLSEYTPSELLSLSQSVTPELSSAWPMNLNATEYINAASSSWFIVTDSSMFSSNLHTVTVHVDPSPGVLSPNTSHSTTSISSALLMDTDIYMLTDITDHIQHSSAQQSMIISNTDLPDSAYFLDTNLSLESSANSFSVYDADMIIESLVPFMQSTVEQTSSRSTSVLTINEMSSSRTDLSTLMIESSISSRPFMPFSDATIVITDATLINSDIYTPINTESQIEQLSTSSTVILTELTADVLYTTDMTDILTDSQMQITGTTSYVFTSAQIQYSIELSQESSEYSSLLNDSMEISDSVSSVLNHTAAPDYISVGASSDFTSLTDPMPHYSDSSHTDLNRFSSLISDASQQYYSATGSEIIIQESSMTNLTETLPLVIESSTSAFMDTSPSIWDVDNNIHTSALDSDFVSFSSGDELESYQSASIFLTASPGLNSDMAIYSSLSVGELNTSDIETMQTSVVSLSDNYNQILESVSSGMHHQDSFAYESRQSLYTEMTDTAEPHTAEPHSMLYITTTYEDREETISTEDLSLFPTLLPYESMTSALHASMIYTNLHDNSSVKLTSIDETSNYDLYDSSGLLSDDQTVSVFVLYNFTTELIYSSDNIYSTTSGGFDSSFFTDMNLVTWAPVSSFVDDYMQSSLYTPHGTNISEEVSQSGSMLNSLSPSSSAVSENIIYSDSHDYLNLTDFTITSAWVFNLSSLHATRDIDIVNITDVITDDNLQTYSLSDSFPYSVSSESILSGHTTSYIDSPYSEHIYTSLDERTWMESFDSATDSSDFETIALYTQAGVSESISSSEILETSSDTGTESVVYESTIDSIINSFALSLESISISMISDSVYVPSMISVLVSMDTPLPMDTSLHVPVMATLSVDPYQTDFTEIISINESFSAMVGESIKQSLSEMIVESSLSTAQWDLISSIEMLSVISSPETQYVTVSLSDRDTYKSSLFDISLSDSIQSSVFLDYSAFTPSSEVDTEITRQVIDSSSFIIPPTTIPGESLSLYIQSLREETSYVMPDISPPSTSIVLPSTYSELSSSLSTSVDRLSASSSVGTLVISTVSIVPDGVTPDATEPTLDTSEKLKDDWIVTVIKVPRTVNIGGVAFMQSIEESLVAAYSDAFQRQHQMTNGTYIPLKRRRKRYAQKDDLKLEVIETSRVLGSNEVNVVYYMKNDAGIVPAQTAIDALSLFTDQELAIKLGYVVQTIAKPYVAVPVAEDSQLWIIGAVLGSVAAVIIIVWISLCCYFRWCRYISFNPPSHAHPVSDEPTLTSIAQQHKVSPFSEASEMERGLKKGTPSPRGSKVVIHRDSYTLNGSARHTADNDMNEDVYAVVKNPKKRRSDPVPAPSYRRTTDVPVDTGTEATESQTESETDPRTGDRHGNTRFKYHPVNAAARPLLRVQAPTRRQEAQNHATQITPKLERNVEVERQPNKQRLRQGKKEPSKAFVLMGHKRTDEPALQCQSDDDAILSKSAHSPEQGHSTQNGLPPIRPKLPAGYVNAAYSGSDTDIDQSQASLERTRGRMHQLLDNAFPLTKPRSRGSRERPSSGVAESLSSSSQSSIAAKRRNGSIVQNRVSKQRKSKRIPDIPHTPLLIDRSEKLQQISQSQPSPYTAGDRAAKMIDRGTEQVIDPEKAVREGSLALKHPGTMTPEYQPSLNHRPPGTMTPEYQPSLNHRPQSASNYQNQVSPRHNPAADRSAWPAHSSQSQHVEQNGIDQSVYPSQQRHHAWSDPEGRVDNESSPSSFSRLRMPHEPIMGSVSGVSVQSYPRSPQHNHNTSRMSDSGSSWLYLSGIEAGHRGGPVLSTSIPNSVEMREFDSSYREYNGDVSKVASLRPKKSMADLHNVDEIDLINESLQPGVSPQPLIQAIRAELEKVRLASARDNTVTSV